MTPRFKIALAVFGALVLATGALWIALGGAFREKKPVKVAAKPEASQPRPGLPFTAGDHRLAGNPGAPGGPDGEDEEDGIEPEDVMRPGLRVPSGEDLSDPKVVRELLGEHMSQPVIEWKTVKSLFEVLQEPLSPELRQRVLEELRIGNRVGVLSAMSVLRDPSFTSDLLAMLDEPGLVAQARQAALQALYSMPNLDQGEVVRGIESRMTGDQHRDTQLLAAIGERGGKEAARALVQYLQGAQDPRRIQVWILQRLNLKADPEAAEVVATAIKSEQPPEVLRALLGMVGPGANALVDPIASLNREGIPEDIRQDAVSSLGRIGTDGAVAHLLELSGHADAYGDVALRSLSALSDGTPEAAALILKALEGAAGSRRPETTKTNLMVALGTLRYVPALPAMGEGLKDPAPEIRSAAIRGLGRMGPPARAYVPDLITLYSSGDEMIKRNVITALGNVGGEPARNALLQMRDDPKLPPSLQRTVQVAILTALQQTPESPTSGKAPTLEGK